MSARLVKVLALLLAGVTYWFVVCQATGKNETWDANGYRGFWYPISLALSAVAGYVLGNDGWPAGAILTFAQLPVIYLNSEIGASFAVGLLLLCVLAVPAVAISALAGLLAMRARPS